MPINTIVNIIAIGGTIVLNNSLFTRILIVGVLSLVQSVLPLR